MKSTVAAAMTFLFSITHLPCLGQEFHCDGVQHNPESFASASEACASHLESQSSVSSPICASGGNVGQPINLDLSSTSQNTSINHIANNQVINIDVGGATKSVTAGMALTQAEKTAVYQVLFSGQQSLVLDSLGAAVGGTMTIGSYLGRNLTGLVVPEGVTVIDKSLSLNLTGGLTNAGNIYLVSSNPAVNTANLTAGDIVNLQTGLISTYLPSALNGVADGLLSGLNLNLTSLNGILNQGIINSSGALSLTAGTTVANITGVAGITPVIQAVNDITITSGIGSIVNSGLITTNAGNVTFSAPNSIDLLLNNIGGNIQALNQTINMREIAYNGTANTNLFGGDLLSKTLNINAGQGTSDILADTVTGTINANGYAAHVFAGTDNLVLGKITLVDPTFYNIGNITLSDDISVNEALTIAATGNITASSGITITARNEEGVGQQINLIAGGNIDTSKCTSCTGLSDVSGAIANGGGSVTAGYIVIKAPTAGATGGSVDFSAGSSTIDSSGTTVGGGGDVNILAFAGTSANSGQIKFTSDSNIVTSSGMDYGETGNSGSVKIIGGGALIKAPVINTGSYRGKGGDITVATAQAGVGGGLRAYSDGHIEGTITLGTPTSGNVEITSLTTMAQQAVGYHNLNSSGNVTVVSTGNLALSGIDTSSTLGKAGNVTVIAGGTINRLNNASSYISANATGTGGIYLGGGTSAPGGNVKVVAGTNFTFSGNSINLKGASVSGGDIFMDGIATGSVNSTAGTITVGAYKGENANGNVSIGFLNASTTLYVDLYSFNYGFNNISFLPAGGNNVLVAAAGNLSVAGVNTGLGLFLDSNATSSFLADAPYTLPVKPAGSATLVAGGNVTTGSINTSANAMMVVGNGGNIRVASGADFTFNGSGVAFTGAASATGGNMSVGSMSTSARYGNGGTVTLTAHQGTSANGNVSGGSASIDTRSVGGQNTTVGGSVTIAASGNVSVGSTIDTRALTGTGNGGAIKIVAGTDFTLSGANFILNNVSAKGGNIALGGAVQASGYGAGTSGAITLAASKGTVSAGNINFSRLTTIGTQSAGGVVTLMAGGNITGTTNIETYSGTGNGGIVKLYAGNNFAINNNAITFGNASTNGGNILLNGFVSTKSDASKGGAVVFSAYKGDTSNGTINVGNINSYGGTFQSNTYSSAGSGGNIVLAADGSVTTGAIQAYGYGGNGGVVTLVSGNSVTTNNISTVSGLNANDSGNAGAIKIIAGTDFTFNGSAVTTGAASATGGNVSLGLVSAGISGGQGIGNGAAVTVAAHDGNISLGGITATGTVNGGNVTIAAGKSVTSTAGISVTGTNGNGGSLRIVAGADFTSNGTAVTVTGVSGESGNISIRSVSTASASGDRAGTITLAAYNGNITSSDLYSWSSGTAGAISVIAGGDITIDIGNGAVGAYSSESLGNVVKIIAGANFDNNLVVSGASDSGGDLYIKGSVDTSGGNGRSGAIMLAAYKGENANGDLHVGAVSAIAHGGASGSISLAAGGSITSVGDISNYTEYVDQNGTLTGGNSGNIKITAGADFTLSGTTFALVGNTVNGGDISVGSVVTNADGGKAGTITILAHSGDNANGNIVVGGIAAQGTGGGVTTMMAGGGVNIEGAVDINASNSNGGSLKVIAGVNYTVTGNSINLVDVSGNEGNIEIGSSTITTNSAVAHAGTITLLAHNGAIHLDSIEANGAINGGSITLQAGKSISADSVINANGTTGNGGNLKIVAGADFTANGSQINGASDSGGNISLSDVYAKSTGSGLGGTVTMAAYNGDNADGNITTSDIIALGQSGAKSITMAAGGDISISNEVSARTINGNGGTIKITSGADFTFNGNNITINGASGNSGDFTVGKAIATSDNGGKAGAITIRAFGGTIIGEQFNADSGSGNKISLIADQDVTVAYVVAPNALLTANNGVITGFSGSPLSLSSNQASLILSAHASGTSVSRRFTNPDSFQISNGNMLIDVNLPAVMLAGNNLLLNAVKALDFAPFSEEIGLGNKKNANKNANRAVLTLLPVKRSARTISPEAMILRQGQQEFPLQGWVNEDVSVTEDESLSCELTDLPISNGSNGQISSSQLGADKATTPKVIQTADVKVRLFGDSEADIKDSTIHLKSGEILIAAKGNTRLLYDKHLFALKPKSLTLAKVDAQGTVHLFQLSDAAAKSLSACFGQRSINISCGQELCFDTNRDNIVSSMKVDRIPRRNISYHDIPDYGTVSNSEFSLVSLLQTNKLLADLLHSQQSEDKQVCNNLLKMAAALYMVTSKHGPFASVAP
ncbi:MAG: hypothetical protein K2W82_04680 [Candidatus Obscuribacterales bacterium]|nr:hypothetical protein [Candidatus Obscuribacterales bacterium]